MIYGYDSCTINEFGLMEMREVTISASPDVLRELARFLIESADELEGPVSWHWHRHAPNELVTRLGCDIVVANGKREIP